MQYGRASQARDVVTPVQQIKHKRAGVGLRAWDLAKACPGLTLFTPMGGEATVYLIDLAGELIHTWCMPYPALCAYLTKRGTLVYNGCTGCDPEDNFRSLTPWNGGVLLEVDWNG